jgi:hypothetical protein
MARLYGSGVKSAIKTKLDAEFNLMIDTLRIKYGDSTIPYCANFTITELLYTFPECTIDIDGDTVIQEEILNDDIEIEGEIYPVKLNCIIMTQANAISAYADYYNEAFERVLHGCKMPDVTWCRSKGMKSQELIDENMQTYKSCGGKFEVRIN